MSQIEESDHESVCTKFDQSSNTIIKRQLEEKDVIISTL